MKKFIYRIVAILTLLATLVPSVPSLVYADSSVNTGEQGTEKPIGWGILNTDYKGVSAWQKFVAINVWNGGGYRYFASEQGLINFVNKTGSAGSGTAKICQQSQYIAYWAQTGQAGNNNVGYHLATKVGGSNNYGILNFSTNPSLKAAQVRFWNGMITDDHAATWRTGNAIIFCASEGSPYNEPPVKITREYTCKDTPLETTDEKRFIGVYSVATKVVPEKPTEYYQATNEGPVFSSQKRAEWDATHETQFTGEKKTEFGEWYDANKERFNQIRNYQDWLYLRKEMESKAQEGKSRTAIELSEKNKSSLAKGGVITTTEQQRKIVIKAPFKQNWKRCGTLKTTTPLSGNAKPVQEEEGTWTNVEKGDPVLVRQPLLTRTSLIDVTKRQVLNVRCNKEEFSLVKAEAQAQGDLTEKYYSGPAKDQSAGSGTAVGTLITREYVLSDDVGTVLQQVPFANPSRGNNNHLKKTLNESFYTKTKSCEFTCSVDPNNSPLAEVKKNDVSTDKVGQYIEQGVTKTLENKFQFFRDNVGHLVRANMWYATAPSNSPEMVINKGDGAKTTQLTFDKNGTPKGELFQLRKEDDSTVIATGTTVANPGYVNVAGGLNKFNFASSWQSDSNLLERFNVAWGYEGKILSYLPTTLSRTEAGNNKYVTTNVDVICDLAPNNSGQQKARVSNTQTGTIPPKDSFNDKEGTWVGALFVRSSAE